MNYNQEVGTVHLLSAMMSEPDSFLHYVLKSLHIEENDFSRDLDHLEMCIRDSHKVVTEVPGVMPNPTAERVMP